MSRTTRTALTERTGVLAVDTIFTTDFGWFFREQPLLDWGIDAHVEQVCGGRPTGKLFALQIKTGSSYFRARGSDFIYHGELKHLDYWTDHSLPVYLILHDPKAGRTLWQRIDRKACSVSKRGWSIIIPAGNVLDAGAKPYFEAGVARDEPGSRRLRFAIDADLMQSIEDQDVYLRWEDWVNKGLGLRNLKLFIGDRDPSELGAPDADYGMWWLPTHDVALAMSIFFPWLEYEYAEDVEENNECEVHLLVGRLTNAAKGYIAAERYFRQGTSWQGPAPPYALNEDDEFHLALEQDWEEEWKESKRRE